MNSLRSILRVVVIWRLGLLLVAWVVLSRVGFLFPYPNFQYLIELGRKVPLIWSWAAFDGVHYITIAERGYVADFTQAFFPIYPLMMRWASSVFQINALWSGLVVTQVALLVAAALFWKLLRLDYGKELSRLTIFLWLLFPTAYYLGSVYSESLFLALVFGCFLAARKKRWWLAGLIGAVASATRPVGIFLLPALLVENWLQVRNVKKRKFGIRNLEFGIWLVPLGLALYMWYLGVHFGDPLKFFHSQPSFGASRSDKIILLYQVLWRYFKMMYTVDPSSLLFYRVFQEFWWSAVFLVLGIVSFKKTRLSYAVFAGLAYLAPTLTGTFSSMPRYVLVMFPVFILAAGWLENKPRWRLVWYVVSGVWLIINMGLFLTGRFIA